MPTLMSVGALQNAGAPGAAFGARTAVTVGAGTSVIIPQGFWIVETDAGETVRWTYNSGSNFVILVPASTVAALVYSDGYAVEFRGGAGGTAQRTQIFPMSA